MNEGFTHFVAVVALFMSALALLNSRDVLRLCDGEAIAASLWGKQMEEKCVPHNTPFRQFVGEI